MRTRRYLAALVVGILAGGLLSATRANAGTLHWASWGGDFDPSVGLGSNLNSTVVVGVGRTDGRVRYRDASAGPWTDTRTCSESTPGAGCGAATGRAGRSSDRA